MSQLCENSKVLRKCLRYFRFIPKVVLFAIISFISIFLTHAQDNKDTIQYLNLDQCIVYALQHQPAMMQSSINVSVARKTNAINLSAWIPQVYLTGDFTHYGQLPSTFETNPANPAGPLIPVHSGVSNTFLPQVSATETIFSPDVLYAARSAHLLVKQAQQSMDSTKINLISTVSKSFYNLLNTLEQINVLKEDTARLGKNLRDTYRQNIGGIVDETDYKEAYISLNVSKSQLKHANESVRPEYASLKQLMGLSPQTKFNVIFDTLQMMQEITFDTTQQLQYEKRIEYQQLQTSKSLQKQTLNYYRTQFLPTLSAFYDYTYEYESSTYSNFFAQAYSFSYAGASISIPLFTGFRRNESIQKTKLIGQQIDWAEVDLKSRIYSEYTNAMANYKSYLYDLSILRDNVKMAKEVYVIVSLQYKQGVIAYLNVITAESNLISSEISYLNALFEVLSSKVDLEKAMGTLSN